MVHLVIRDTFAHNSCYGTKRFEAQRSLEQCHCDLRHKLTNIILKEPGTLKTDAVSNRRQKHCQVAAPDELFLEELYYYSINLFNKELFFELT